MKNIEGSAQIVFHRYLIAVLCIAGIFYILFFFDYFLNIEKYLLPHFDWIKRLRFYADVKHQIFTLRQFPHYHTYYFKGTNVLFANAEESVLTPVNLLLPFVSLYHFFIYHLSIHYLCALVGFVLLRKLFNLPYFSILVMFVIFGFNGRILSNYYVGHAGFITYMWLPLLFYFYFSFMRSLTRTLFYASATALTMTMIFFEGGVHLINWILLLFIGDGVLIVGGAIIQRGGTSARRIGAPLRFWVVTLLLFTGLSALKLFPVCYTWGGMQFVGGGLGYRDICFFAQTFYQSGLGSSIPFKEFWLQEAYNYIGMGASLLAIAALVYALFMQGDALVRRIAILALLFLVFSMDTIYISIFGHVPVVQQERAPTRFVFIALALISVLIPIFLSRVMERLKIAASIRELLMLFIGATVYCRLFLESRKWMVIGTHFIDPQIRLSPRWEVPAGYLFYFHTGLIVSIATVILLITIAIVHHRLSGGGAHGNALTNWP